VHIIDEIETPMRAIITLLLTTVTLWLAAQTVPKTHNSLIIKRTATWCPTCGGWGWTTFETLVSDNDDRALLWAVHYSGDLQNPTAVGINGILSGASQPRFYLNLEDVTNSGDIAQTVKNGVAAQSNESPVAQAIIKDATVENGKLTATAVVEFFQDMSFPHQLLWNIYVVENGVVNQQAGQGQNAVHEKVLRDEMAGSVFGDVLINNGTVTVGQTETKTFNIPIANDWDLSNIELHVVLWEKDGFNYSFINGSDIDLSSLVAVRPISAELPVQMDLVTNPVSRGEAIRVRIQSPVPLTGHMVLYDAAGRPVATPVKETTWPAGERELSLDGTSSLPAGTYHLVFRSGQNVVTRQAVVN